MHEISAIGLFCDDIREEKSGQFSLIGIIGDNVRVPSFPGMIPKLAMHVRIHLSENFKPTDFKILLCHADGTSSEVNEIKRSLVEKTLTDVKRKGGKVAGVYSHLIASPFPVQTEGRMWLELRWDDDSIYLGGLNFELIGEDANNSAHEFQQPT